MLDELGITANSDVNLKPSDYVDLTDGPLIQVLSPNLDDEIIASPMDIEIKFCLLYTSPSPRDATLSRMPSSA